MADLVNLNHLRIPLADIKSATENFAQHNILGQGGFGKVYQGQLHSDCEPAGTTIAVKRFDENLRSGQGRHEFLMEIAMLASCKHTNLVSLIGFCDESSEKILVYNKEDNGSLDRHLDSTDLSWEQRLRICLGAARGLEYLHASVGTVHRVLHRDVKSSNILLNENWEAKISDFGLSRTGPKNLPYTFVVTAPCGTPGYVDPLYATTGVLTKESDVYSFGVVLFEVLCGKPAVIVENGDELKFLSTMVNDYYGQGRLQEIIFPSLVEQMKLDSLDIFSNIAFRCLNLDRQLRPTMTYVVEELESALENQLGKRIIEPERQTGTRTRLWGSEKGGIPFLFQLQSNQRLRKIIIFHQYWIRSLEFTVEDCNGSLETKRYGVQPYHMWVQDGTNARMFVIDLDADEEIIGLSGSVRKYKHDHELVTTLYVTTNKKKSGTFTPEADDRFSGSWDAGLFDGFYGRVGQYIDAIGCCLKDTSLVD